MSNNFCLKKVFVSLMIVLSLLYTSACNKGSGNGIDIRQNQPNSLTDSVATLAQRWQLIKDSSTNIGNYYFLEGGTSYVPTPGVYFGTTNDYWEFRIDGSSTLHANNNTYNSTYILHSGNKLEVAGLMAHGMATVIKLTFNEAIFDWSNTSPNGGIYFRRSYLKK